MVFKKKNISKMMRKIGFTVLKTKLLMKKNPRGLGSLARVFLHDRVEKELGTTHFGL